MVFTWRDLRLWWRDECTRRGLHLGTHHDMFYPEPALFVFAPSRMIPADADDAFPMREENKDGLMVKLDNIDRERIAGSRWVVFDLTLGEDKTSVYVDYAPIVGADCRRV
jgi:hypothetical protein